MSAPPAPAAARRPRMLLLPAAVLLATALVWLLSAWAGTAVALAVAVALLPVGSRLGERLVTGATLVLIAVSVVFVVAPVPVTRASAAVFVLALPVLSALASVLRHPAALLRERLPAVGLGDAGVLVAGAGAAAWFLVPSLTTSLSANLTRLYYGWDHVLHFTMFNDVYRYGRLSGLVIDGSPAYLSSNPQLHPTLWAVVARAGQAGGATLPGPTVLQAYILLAALTAACCVAALSWVAADLVVALGRGAVPDACAGLAALVVGVLSVLGTPSAVFFFGHTPFLLGVTATVVGSYLAVRADGRGGVRGTVLGLALLAGSALVVLLEWPPLVLGLVAAGIYLVVRLVAHRPRAIAALAVLVVAAVVLAPRWYPALVGRVTIDTLVAAIGQPAAFSRAVFVAAVVVTVVVAVVLVVARDPARAVSTAGPVAGMVAFCAVLVAAGADWTGRIPSYYLHKTMEGCIIAATPLAVALVVASSVLLVRALRRPRTRQPVAVWVSVVGAAVVLVAIATSVVKSPPDSVVTGIPKPLDSQEGYAAAADLIARAYPVTPSAEVDLPVLVDLAAERSNLWLLGLQRGVSEADHEFYAALPTLYPRDVTRPGQARVPPTAWAPVFCGALTVRPPGQVVALTDQRAVTRAWAAKVGRSCDTSQLTIVAIP